MTTPSAQWVSPAEAARRAGEAHVSAECYRAGFHAGWTRAWEEFHESLIVSKAGVVMHGNDNSNVVREGDYKVQEEEYQYEEEGVEEQEEELFELDAEWARVFAEGAARRRREKAEMEKREAEMEMRTRMRNVKAVESAGARDRRIEKYARKKYGEHAQKVLVAEARLDAQFERESALGYAPLWPVVGIVREYGSDEEQQNDKREEEQEQDLHRDMHMDSNEMLEDVERSFEECAIVI